MLAPNEFYLSDAPTHLQQGDICAGVPLILFPDSDELVLIRSEHERQQLEHLNAGRVDLVREKAVADAFDGTHEYIAVAAERVWAMLMTPTCDLDGLEVWAVWPMYTVEGAIPNVVRALSAPDHPTLVPLPDNDRFPLSYIDLTDFRSIGKRHFPLKNRIASVTKEAQYTLTERFVKATGRPWGYGPGEVVERTGKHETGKYRCARCNFYDVAVPEIPLKPGELFPVCDNCKKIGKTAQWYPTTRHKKS
ncbi:MAG: hypothetical protein WBV69_04910 [Candidatus Sulfotelmatobacter sp.]